MLREALRLVAPQGFEFHTPPPGAPAWGDVLVPPLPGSPEEAAYRGSPVRAHYVVSHRDAWRALALSLIAPRSAYRSLLVGVDPGSTCAYAAVGDGILLGAGRAPCDSLAPRIAEILSRIPHAAGRVSLGTGPGATAASLSLEEAGIPYTLVDEYRTTASAAPAPLARPWMDEDVRAAALIAVAGRYLEARR